MIERGLKGVRLVVGDRCAGLVSTVDSMLPKARDQRCMVHFLRNVLSKVPPSHREWASAALKAVFAMESRESTLDKAETVASDMKARRPKAAADCLGEDIQETTTYLLDEVSCGTPQAHPHERHDRTAQPRDQAAHARRGKLPRREQRAHARLRAYQVRRRERMVQPALPRHVPARWQSRGSELIIMPWTAITQSTQSFGHYHAVLRGPGSVI